MKSCDNAANPSRDDEQRGGDDKGPEDVEEKLVHEVMILHAEGKG